MTLAKVKTNIQTYFNSAFHQPHILVEMVPNSARDFPELFFWGDVDHHVHLPRGRQNEGLTLEDPQRCPLKDRPH